jgi:carboxypeptidase PM20D1
MTRVLGALFVALVVLSAVLVTRTLLFIAPERPAVEPQPVEVDAERVAQRLAEAIRFETVSLQGEPRRDPQAFEAFLSWFEATYADVRATVEYQRVAQYTPLLEWKGSDASLEPVLLTAHYDVVPVSPGTEDRWEQPPYSGHIDDSSVWGRGALDDKSAMIAQLEAVSLLLRSGFQPTRTIYLSFGHDEELGGPEGAGGVAALLQERGVTLAWSLDEGSFVVQGLLPGIEASVASINVAEKGSVTVDLVATAVGGHSSMPPPETAVGILAGAIVRLQDAPLPGGLDGVAGDMFGALARYMPFERRLLFANLWLFGGWLEGGIGRSAFGNAMIRTTTAPTMLRGGIKSNVLPTEAVATVNFRLHPRDTPEGVVEHIRLAIDDPRVEIRARPGGRAASAVSSATSEGFAALARASRSTFGDVIVVPGITIGGTDSKHYGGVARDTYRFNPMLVTQSDVASFHGTNERISIDNLQKATAFYVRLLRDVAGPSR